MTTYDLANALGPVTDEALAAPDDEVVRKLSIVLGAIMGAIEDGDADQADHEVVDALAIHAGLICQHRAGRHSS